MARNTGPGKVSDNLDKTPRPGVTGLLFNFDVEGDAVKPEHERWLVANVIPLLACEQAVGSLKGMASRSGSASYNLQLSQKRVENVKKLLAARGASPAKLNALWVGEEAAALAGVADGTEDERARAVGVAVQFPPRRGILHFTREDPRDIEDGFDPGATPEWLMVPTFDRRQLVLRNGSGVRLVSSHPTRLQFVDPVSLRRVNELVVTANRQVVQFVGNLPGRAHVDGHDLGTGAVERLLDVDVAEPRQFTVALHNVTDPEHPTPQRIQAEVAEMLRAARRIFKRQANVTIDTVSDLPDTLRFSRNLSDPTVPPVDGQRPMTLATVGGRGFPVLANRANRAARINVFFVWEWQNRAGTNDTNARVDEIPGRMVIFEDDTGGPTATHDGYTLAHEFGHCLALEHVDEENLANATRLMWPFTNQHHGRLTRDDVRTLRRNLR